MNRLAQYAGPYYAAKLSAPAGPVLLYPGERKRKARRPINWQKLAWIAVGFAVGFCSRCAFPDELAEANQVSPVEQTEQADQKPVVAPPRIPRSAAELALTDEAVTNPLVFYLWSPSASDRDYYAASVVLSAVVNQSTSPYHPEKVLATIGDKVVWPGLIRVNIAQLVDDEAGIKHILSVLAKQAENEPYFTLTSVVEAAGDKKGEIKTKTVISAAPHLGDAAKIGIGKIYRVDQFCDRAIRTADDGLYYAWRGIEAGKTKLNDYLKSRGFNLAEGLKTNSIDQAVTLSHVTSSPRVLIFGRSQGIKPSKGSGLVAITKDLAVGANDPNKNPFQSLLNDNQKYFKETILQLPNGQQEFALWNEDDVAIAEADPRVATDSTVPHPFPARLQPASSCISCHGGDAGMKPFDTEFVYNGSARLVKADVSKADQFAAYQAIRSRFSATQPEVDAFLANARDSLAAQYDFLSIHEHQGGKAAYEALTSLENDYRNSWVTPAKACEEIGLTGGKPQELLAAAIPPSDAVPQGSAGIVNRLRDGRDVSRAEWEAVFVELMQQVTPAIQTKTEFKR